MSDDPLLTPEEELVIAAKLAAIDPPEPVPGAEGLPDDVKDEPLDEDDPDVQEEPITEPKEV